MRLTQLTLVLSALSLSLSAMAQDRRPKKRTPRAPAAAKAQPKPAPVAPEEEGPDLEQQAPDEVQPDDEDTTDVAEAAPANPNPPAEAAEAAEPQEVVEPAETMEPAGTEAVAPVHATPATSALPIWASQCSREDIRIVGMTAGRSLVHVEAPGGRGLGFVFHSRSHVVAPASLVDTGRGIRVRFQRSGGAVAARVVAIDQASDIAVLKLDAPAPNKPLTIGTDQLNVGDPVLTVLQSTDFSDEDEVRKNKSYLRARRGHMRDRADTIVEAGTVTFAGGRRLRASMLGDGADHWGAPLLDCNGGVVGVATSPISDEAASLGALGAIADDIGDEQVYWGRWSGFRPHGAFVGQLDHMPRQGFEDRDGWLGFSFGNALIGYDRLFLPARFTTTFLVGPQLDNALDKRDGFRLQGSLGIGYRMMLKGGTTPVYLVPVIGGTIMYERIKTETTQLVVDAPCLEGGCVATPQVTESVTELTRAMPTFGGGLQIGPAEVQYQFIYDTEITDRSVHQLSLGVQF